MRRRRVPVHVPQVGALWDEADVVLAVGSDLDAVMTQNWAMPRPAKLVAVNVDAADASKNWRPDVLVEADARLGVEALAARLRRERTARQQARGQTRWRRACGRSATRSRPTSRRTSRARWSCSPRFATGCRRTR